MPEAGEGRTPPDSRTSDTGADAEAGQRKERRRMGRRMRGLADLALPLIILAVGLGLRILDPPLLVELRNRGFDVLQRVEPRQYDPQTPVRIIAIDEASLARLGQWPWPRTVLARLIAELQEAGAAAVALDILIAEPDRTSPANAVRSWDDDTRDRLLRPGIDPSEVPDNDEVLADVMRRGGVVAAFFGTGQARESKPAVKYGMAFTGEDPAGYLYPFGGVVNTISPLVAAASGYGSVNSVKDVDGLVRRMPLLVRIDEQAFPSLGAEALRVALGASTYIVRGTGQAGVEGSGAGTGIEAVRIGNVEVNTNPNGQILLYDTGHQPERFIPAWLVLEGLFDPAEVAGKVIFIGATAGALFDVHVTPLQQTAIGVEQHAQIVEQVINGEFLIRPAWADGLERWYVLLFSVLIMVAFSWQRIGTRWSVALGAALITGSIAGSFYAFRQYGFLLDPVYPAIVGTMVFLSLAVTSYLRSDAERRYVRQAFGQYLSPSLVERIADNPDALRLGGEQRELTVLFCDIRGFTSISERLDATGVTRLLNRFLTPMSDVIMGLDGTIDKYMGDAIMAFWNAPIDDDEHAAKATRAALEMRWRLAEVNADLRRDGLLPEDLPGIRIGIGLNSGSCSVGNLGSDQRFDYSAIGDTVNLASRLEGQCKTYGADIVVGESTRNAVPTGEFVELDLIRVIGKAEPTRVYTPLEADAAAENALAQFRAQHEEMLTSYRAQDWDAAEAARQRAQATGEMFGLGAYYRLMGERIAAFRDAPPPADWDGVAAMESK